MDASTFSVPDAHRLRLRCLAHARDLIDSARAVLSRGHPHIAHHLAVLALEEIGKGDLLGMRAAASRYGDVPPWIEKHADDHLKKLFWALWGPQFGRTRMTSQEVKTVRGLAARLHATRMAGLYVSLEPESDAPSERVTRCEAEHVIGLAESRLALGEGSEPRELTEDDRALVDWFHISSLDAKRRRIILGGESMGKLAELGDVRQWMTWLRETIEHEEAEIRQLLRSELERGRPEEPEAGQPKWKVRFRLLSGSHSIRPKALAWWNSRVPVLQLSAVGKRKQDLSVDLLLTKGVLLPNVWAASWLEGRRFVAAMNIGTMGFFWWEMPKYTGRFYEWIRDLQNGLDVTADRDPELRIDWGRRALGEQEFERVAICFAMLPSPLDDCAFEPVERYVDGLGLLGKSDLLARFEVIAVGEFYSALKLAARLYRDWDGVHDYFVWFDQFLTSRGMRDPEQRRFYWQVGECLERHEQPTGEVSLREAGIMKLLCDSYFYETFVRRVREGAGARSVPKP